MNAIAMANLAKSVLTSLAALAIAACSPSQPAAPPPLEGASIGGPFTLVDASGKTVNWSDFDGKWRMVYFGYAYCPDVCPFDLQRMMQGYEAFKREKPDLAADVVPIFITIDPERDTPEVVGKFTSNFSPDLVGLTGTPEQVDQAAKAFTVYYAKGDVQDNGGYLMDHTNAAYLMDRQGKPIALLSVDESAPQVAAELDEWVN